MKRAFRSEHPGMKDLPNEDEVRRSGTGDWVDQAVRAQERKNQKLSSMLGEDAEALRRQKAELAGMFDKSAHTEEENVDRGPDLFADEREQARRQQASLAGLFGDAAAKEKENEELLGMFGFEQKPRSKKRK